VNPGLCEKKEVTSRTTWKIFAYHRLGTPGRLVYMDMSFRNHYTYVDVYILDLMS